MLKTLRIIWRAFLFILITIPVVISQSAVLFLTKTKGAYAIPFLWQNGVRRIFGIEMIIEGKPAHDDQVLFVGNHLSYLDIPLVGSVVKASFVARGDLSGWPVFGYLARLQQTIFISRKREDALAGRELLETSLTQGKSLIIFAEGTSSNGAQILPFKSSLFGLAYDNPTGKHLPVQPFTISLLEIDGKPVASDTQRDLYAWHSDMTLPDHILAFAGRRGAKLKVTFHPPLDSDAFKNRKDLCRAAEQLVRNGLLLPEAASATQNANANNEQLTETTL